MNLFKRTQSPQEQRREHKTVHYTLTPIGTGPEALAAWKADRERFEAEWQLAQAPKREERRLAAIEAVALQNKTLALDDLEAAESLYLDTGVAKPVTASPIDTLSTQPEPKPSWLTRLWRTAFPE